MATTIMLSGYRYKMDVNRWFKTDMTIASFLSQYVEEDKFFVTDHHLVISDMKRCRTVSQVTFMITNRRSYKVEQHGHKC